MGAGTAKDRVGRIEEAQRLRERGLSYPQIAAQMGVGIATAHWIASVRTGASATETAATARG